MKSLKRVFSIIIALAFSASLCLAPCAYASNTSYVFDEYGVLDSSDITKLEKHAAQLASDYNQGVYLVFTDSMGSSNPSPTERNNFARRIYENNNFGVGTNKQGIIFVVAVDTRDYVTVKKQGSDDPFSDECVDALESRVTDYLSDNDWSGAAYEYYDVVDEQLAYYAATGEQWTEPDLIGFILKILATLGIPAAVAGSIIGGQKRAMKTAEEKYEASDYVDESSLNLTAMSDQFVNTSLVATPRSEEKSSGGGWSDMGGGFSGSGGGKF